MKNLLSLIVLVLVASTAFSAHAVGVRVYGLDADNRRVGFYDNMSECKASKKNNKRVVKCISKKDYDAGNYSMKLTGYAVGGNSE